MMIIVPCLNRWQLQVQKDVSCSLIPHRMPQKEAEALVELGSNSFFLMNITWLNEIMSNAQWTTSKNCNGILKKELTIKWKERYLKPIFS